MTWNFHRNNGERKKLIIIKAYEYIRDMLNEVFKLNIGSSRFITKKLWSLTCNCFRRNIYIQFNIDITPHFIFQDVYLTSSAKSVYIYECISANFFSTFLFHFYEIADVYCCLHRVNSVYVDLYLQISISYMCNCITMYHTPFYLLSYRCFNKCLIYLRLYFVFFLVLCFQYPYLINV